MTPTWKDLEELYNELYDDTGDVWAQFLEEWKEKHPDIVDQLVTEYIDKNAKDDWDEWLIRYVELEQADAADAYYHAMKDMR